jgi:FtsP/CotA-like multicopper oxidase with cupredoxin domain
LDHNTKGPLEATSLGNKFVLQPHEHIFRAPTTIRKSWQITAGTRRPDGVLKQVYLVNGEFPGPTIEARSGDRLVISIENRLGNGEGLSIHWHGISMRGANNMDGATGVTQATIEDGESMTYDFSIDNDQHGTFWYHAHDGVQRADGLYGGLVVHQPATHSGNAVAFPDEHLLLIGDWYHRSAVEALSFYMHPGAFGLETIPDSVLLNGQGVFQCADAVPARPLDCVQNRHGNSAFIVDPRRQNRLRVVNVGAYAGFAISSNHSKLTPIAIDGGFDVTRHGSKKVGTMYPGQRMDLLLDSVGGAGGAHETLSISLDDTSFKYKNDALTLTHNYTLAWNSEPELVSNDKTTLEESFDAQDAKPMRSQSAEIADHADLTLVLYAATQKLAHLDNEPHGFVNNTMWNLSPSESPLIDQPRSAWRTDHLIPHIPYNASSPLWVDIVLNNRDEEGHPFHLHGYSVWVLSSYSSDYNWGSYNPFEDSEPPGGPTDMAAAVKRDTVYVPRRGYVVLRFRADNPGLWMFHCHVLWHMGSGMAMALDVS